MMKSLARKIEPQAAPERAEQVVAKVVDVGPEGITLGSAGGPLEARRAASCLLAPEVGDEVLVALIPGRPSYVLAVLERDASTPASLEVEGDLRIQATGGRVSLRGERGLDLATGGDTTVVTGELDVRAARGNVVLERLSYLGSAVLAEVEKVKVTTVSLDTLADRVMSRVKRAYRFVEELDQLRAERFDFVAEKTASVRGENTIVTAEKLVKLDGEQIHVG